MHLLEDYEGTVASLSEARLAYRQGFYLAAAVLGRAAFECHLRALYADYRFGKQAPERLPPCDLLKRLFSKRIIDRFAAINGKFIWSTGSKAAHGEALHWSEISEMLDEIETWQSRYPVSSR